MNYPLYDINGKEVGSFDLPKEIFEIDFIEDIVHQVFLCQSSNRRQGTANTKGRAEVRGGGRKPWRQKGTGRARHGSRRSPIWKGGGVTFGPTNEKNFKKKINKKLRRKALAMILSKKALDKDIFLIDDLKIKEGKTKIISQFLSNLDIKKSAIIATPLKDETIWRASRNIPKISVIPASDLNLLDLLSSKFLIIDKEGIEKIKSLIT